MVWRSTSIKALHFLCKSWPRSLEVPNELEGKGSSYTAIQPINQVHWGGAFQFKVQGGRLPEVRQLASHISSLWLSKHGDSSRYQIQQKAGKPLQYTVQKGQLSMAAAVYSPGYMVTGNPGSLSMYPMYQPIPMAPPNMSYSSYSLSVTGVAHVWRPFTVG